MPTSTMSTIPLPVTSGFLEAKQLSCAAVGFIVQLVVMVGFVEVIVTRNRL